MNSTTGFMPPQHWRQHRLATIIAGTITGAIAAGVLTDEETSSRFLKIIAGAVAGTVAGLAYHLRLIHGIGRNHRIAL